ncbi:MetQ/NlpA family ABC transporter substrate-binding protein [Ornithinimicrobium flavum]|uniref:MetQ/NlpA family ABC transporter substrate-binding protein n=1 Tax=Ornithinimicrobium flavum TaxID=1288636 RepID=UPI003083F12F
MSHHRTLIPLLAAAGALTLAACGGDTTADDNAAATGGQGESVLTVGASTVPHGEILEFVADELAADAGLSIEIVEFTDYVQPNVALDEGALDANYFQHQPYLDQQVADAGYDFVALAPVHLEPLGLYSDSVASVAEIPDGGTVAIPNDPTNGGRALALLAEQGLITLADTQASPTVLDIEDNPKGLEFSEIEAAQLPRSLADVDAAVINGNYAIEADLSPAEDAIAAESAEGNPYANLLVVRAEDEDDAALATLAELLRSEEVAAFIEESYAGAVVPAR